MLYRIVLLACVVVAAPAAAHDCPDPMTRDLERIYRSTVIQYPYGDALSETAIANYQYIVSMATRPEDESIRERACFAIVQAFYMHDLLESRQNDYADCPESTVEAVLAKWADYPNSANADYLPIVRVAPEYPPKALKKDLTGHVVIEFTVTPEGTVRSPRVVSSSDKVFERNAIRAVRKFKYKPRVLDGVPIEVSGVRTKITFGLEEPSHPDHCR